MPERIAIYPGSFDPPTKGHLDLITRATKMFDKVIVAVASNNQKSALFSVKERMEMLKAITKGMPSVTVDTFNGLTVEFARRKKAIALIRGLRVVSDFEFEMTIAVTNQKLDPNIDTVCLMPSERYMLVSSRIIKEVAQFGGDVSDFVSPEVKTRLMKKLKRS